MQKYPTMISTVDHIKAILLLTLQVIAAIKVLQ